ncbi:ABC transporter substrate-binding protein [Ottowia sp. GY511]|uniref:ABC transporter substrate-binding protein n=1 Tax=Ottowia flava TaxID=2675430 RepID=A0ABW4KVU0_9BURK|nr:helical backbone metal receptor [Ottowia sp. GY511]TXK26602.1 ABC transporter substrate-binding protein [Ottowia sp. GY511]
MKRWLCAWWLVLWVCVPAWAYDVTDDTGRTVQFDTPPLRIVSLLPSLTETVCELGGCERLVGVDRYSNWPAPVKRLPQVGGGLDPNVEAVVALKPDLVLASVSTRAADRLRSLGLRVLQMEPRTGAQVREVTQRLGTALQLPTADRVLRAIDSGVDAAALSVPPSLRGQRVYFEASGGPHAAGPQSFIGEMLTRLGLGNIIGPELGPFPRINPELVVRADPDLIMVGARSVRELTGRPGWGQLRALRERRMCVFTTEEVDILVRPGPRMAEAARLMARCAVEKGLRGQREPAR